MNTTTTVRAVARPRANIDCTVIRPRDKLRARRVLEAVDNALDFFEVLSELLGDLDTASLLHIDLLLAFAGALGDARPGPWSCVVDNCNVWLGCDPGTFEGINEHVSSRDLISPALLARLGSTIHHDDDIKGGVAL